MSAWAALLPALHWRDWAEPRTALPKGGRGGVEEKRNDKAARDAIPPPLRLDPECCSGLGPAGHGTVQGLRWFRRPY